MNQLQNAAGWIDAIPGHRDRDALLRRFPAHMIDALVSKGYVAVEKCGAHVVTESGHRFVNDREAKTHD